MNTTAGPALVEALSLDVDRLCAAEPEVRQDLPDSVHSMRVATRRLRSVVKSYRRILRRKPAAEITDELRWLAGLLGVARDAEVKADRFEKLLGDHSGALARADAKNGGKRSPKAKRSGEASFGADLVAKERRIYAGAHAAVLDAFDSRRYTALTERLHDLIDNPPLRHSEADKPAADLFATVLRHDFRALRRLVRIEPTLTEEQRVEHLHDIRKAAKRLRYSAEAAAAVLGEPATLLSRNAKHLQGVLGDHRDAIEAAAALRAHAAESDAPDYQRYCDAEEAAAAKALEQYPAATEFLRDRPL
ncbi:CHAD domain-containing protein [Nocardia huaxiensis]|uniref:CHAD domain-containing protein n=1 Tax=Nocardia huaxiensis TaxID=2755382 RepID=A0A7D6Z792_9NOCA|nr:CHAD domain-containing protein [Nocardia huaxiensis]QLY33444.1 CHAD domain-containing protein [Nocardia huaxiensis]